MDANRVAQQQIAGAGGQDGGREPVHVAIDRRDQRILEVMPVGVDHGGGVAEAVARHENVVDLLVRIEAVAGLGRIGHRRARGDREAHGNSCSARVEQARAVRRAAGGRCRIRRCSWRACPSATPL